MAVENKGTPQYFINTFLNNPATSIPKGAQWCVYFNDLAPLLDAIDNAYKLEPERWKTRSSASRILGDQLQITKGCLFCTAVDIPGEGGNPVAEGSIKSNNFIRSYVGAGRNDFPIMRMSFIDTNISFCESFLRGWSLATSAFGMIARAPNSGKNYRTTLTCVKFAITPGKEGEDVRLKGGATITQSYVFQGICCINVGNEEYNYDNPSSMPKREANFVYNYYTLDTDSHNDVISASTNTRRTQMSQDNQDRQGRINAEIAENEAMRRSKLSKDAQKAILERGRQAREQAANEALKAKQRAKAGLTGPQLAAARRAAEAQSVAQVKKQIANTSGLLAGGGTGGAGLV